MIIVPDASVILKWVLEKASEPDQVQARWLQEAVLTDQVTMTLSALWRFEVGNILSLKQPKLAHELFSVLIAYDFDEVYLGKGYAVEVLEHMREVKGVTFYVLGLSCARDTHEGIISDSRSCLCTKGQAKRSCHLAFGMGMPIVNESFESWRLVGYMVIGDTQDC